MRLNTIGRFTLICMLLWGLVALGFALVKAWTGAAAAQPSFPNVESCGVDFWKHLQVIEEVAIGTPASKLEPAFAPVASLVRDKGVPTAFMTAHAKYADCTKPFLGNGDKAAIAASPFARCAFDSAFRYVILQGISENVPADQRKAASPKALHSVVDVLYRRNAERGFPSAVFLSARAGQDCISEAQKR